MFLNIFNKDEKVEIISTFVGSFVLGASFAKEFIIKGAFELRILLFSIAVSILFFLIFQMAKLRMKVFDKHRPFQSFFWVFFFSLGNLSAYELFLNQFFHVANKNLLQESIMFLLCFALSIDLLFSINRNELLNCFYPKTIYKYLLAPINGLSFGTVITTVFMYLLTKFF